MRSIKTISATLPSVLVTSLQKTTMNTTSPWEPPLAKRESESASKKTSTHQSTGFKKFNAAIKDHDWTTAAIEGRDSRWHKQVTNRAERLMVRLEHFDSLNR